MSDIVPAGGGIQAMSAKDIALVTALANNDLKKPQVSIETQHLFHAGLYARTIRIPAGVRATGTLIKIATVLIISGKVRVFVGNNEVVEIDGFAVIPGQPGRKQAVLAITDTYVSMLFATDAATVEAAEMEFTDETDILASRKSEG